MAQIKSFRELTPAQHREIDAAWQSIGAMLNRMIERAEDFCKHATR